MPLASGQTLSFYEILGPLGAGAMGEVYRAKDTRLDREVAIKVLPEHFAEEEERLRRFEREAKSLASLNHPNVAQIFGVDQQGDTVFLVLELVPGETLEEHIARGALSVGEAVDVCCQIAEGLEAAHEAGVIHRDLKPANVRITPDGKVKVLDFGLAKPTGPGAPKESTTDSVLATEEGRLLGTPTYMAPEQARGKPIDRRVDVWAFGCVLYECLTARRAFAGETISDVLASVLEREPDWTRLPAATPPLVRDVLQRCLTKDAARRLRDVGDARLELERALEGGVLSGSAVVHGSLLSWTHAVALVLGVLLGALLLRESWTRDAEIPRELRLSFDMRMPYQETYPRLAPGGGTVVHEGMLPATEGKPAVRALFRRDLDDFESRLLPGTENPATFCFSPDGEHLAVLVEQSGRGGELTLLRVPLRGGVPNVRLGAWPQQQSRSGGIAWLANGLLVGSTELRQLILFPVDGGATRLLAIQRAFERPGSEVDVFRPLGDGRHVLGRSYYYDERGYLAAVVAIDVETGEEKIVAREAEFGSITEDGRLLFTHGDTLFEAPFDSKRIEKAGPAAPIADGLRTQNTWRAAWFDLAQDGTLIWLPGGTQGTRRHLTILERSGELSPLWPERMSHDGPVATSPDGTYFASVVVSDDGQRVEVWGSTVERPNLRRLLAAPGTDFANPFPLPGGEELIYQRISQAGEDGIYRMRLDASQAPELLLPANPDGPDLQPVGVSPDGSLLLVALDDERGVQFSTLPLPEAAEEFMQPLLRAPRDQYWPKFSADGRWILYVAGEVDRSRLVVQEFRDRALVGPQWPVPTPDGQVPWDSVWSENPDTGQQCILMVDTDRSTVFEVAFEDEGNGIFGAPRSLRTLEDAYVLDAAPLAGGRLLIVVQESVEEEMDRIAVVIGALEER